MKAFTRTIYGGPEVLHMQEIGMPEVKDDEVLVKVAANSANPADWRILRGDPFFARFTYGLFRPRNRTIGSDFSGTIVQTGKNVTGFSIGDLVIGTTLKGGAFAEYVSVPANSCGHIPADAEMIAMACLPIAGLTALQALVKYGKIKAGERVLINGATGGVGHYAVQIAKAYGAIVTAVCSARNRAFVKSLGAADVVAYDEVDIQEHNVHYDLVIDAHGNLSYNDYQRLGTRAVSVGFSTVSNMMRLQLTSALGKLKVAQVAVDINATDLEILSDMVGKGKIKPHIEKTFSSRQIPDAIRHIEQMHTVGKVAMAW